MIAASTRALLRPSKRFAIALAAQPSRDATEPTDVVVGGYAGKSRNGREIVFASNRGGNMDIWSATWDRAAGTWSQPTRLPGAVNTALPESRPSISGDCTRLYFGRGTPPGDVFVSTRVAVHEND